MKKNLYKIILFLLTGLLITCTSPFEKQYLGTISIDPNIINGEIRPSKNKAEVGQEVYLSVIPYSGFKLSGGSLYYTLGAKKVAISASSFKMPAGDIVLHAEFVTQYETKISLTESKISLIGMMSLTGTFATD
ncbi:MAG: hypothetical protein ACRC5H_02345, partial [Treponemataceae bacterium]